MPERSTPLAPRIVALAEYLGAVDTLQPPTKPTSSAHRGRSHTLRLSDSDGRELVKTVILRTGETLVRTADGTACAIVGDSDGDEDHRIRIYVALRRSIRLVHEESPVSPRVHPVGTGFLWIRRDAAHRPHQVIWWSCIYPQPVLLLDEPDRTHRIGLRSVTQNMAILASRGPDSTVHWLLKGGNGAHLTCQPLATNTLDSDAVVWRGDVVVLDRDRGHVRIYASAAFEVATPEGFIAEYLQTAGDALLATGRQAGRQAIWMIAPGLPAVWTAPPAGTMLPSITPEQDLPTFLVSSPVHEPQIVAASAGGEVPAASTGRAVVHCLTAESDDGTAIMVTLFLPPGEESHSLVVHVYGAYGISLEGPFDPFTDDLLARGVAVAYCHIRGGGEIGPEWHRQATGVHQYRSIEDFLACLALLRDLPTIAEERVVVSAASAGALTASAACFRQPTWLRGLHLVHPFVDPLTAMMNPDSNLTTTDWAEFGDPLSDANVRETLEYLSPMATVARLPARSCPLPRAWIRAAHRDSRVDSGAVEHFSRLYRRASTSVTTAHVIYRSTTGGHLRGESADLAHRENILAHAWLLDLLETPFP